MAKCKTAVTTLLIHWSYHILVLSHRHDVACFFLRSCWYFPAGGLSAGAIAGIVIGVILLIILILLILYCCCVKQAPSKGERASANVSGKQLNTCTVMRCDNVVDLAQIPHSRRPIAHLWGEIWDVFCGLKFRFMFSWRCSTVCNIMIQCDAVITRSFF